MKITKKVLFWSLLVIVAAVIVIFILRDYSHVSYNGTIRSSVGSEVTIERNKTGMPYIKAATVDDAYYAIGFLHCQDRLPLMEYFRAAAAGRLNGLIGESGIFMDKLSLTIGFMEKAGIIAGRMKKPYSGYIDSYVKGINDSKKFNYNAKSLKGASKTEWAVKDVISILLMLDWADSFLNNRELVFPVPAKLNNKDMNDLLPQNLRYQYTEEEKLSVSLLLKIRKTIKERVGSFQKGFSFYISGLYTEDGKAVSAFTLDGDMNLYPKFYPLHLTVGDNIIEGVTVSGLPFIFIGRNKEISFSGFNLNTDTQNFYLERTRIINNIRRYWKNGTWNKFSTRDELLYTGSKRTDVDSSLIVRSTEIGPVISDLSDKDDYNCISLRSLFPDESYLASLFNIPFSLSLEEAKKNVWNIHSLPRIYLFATNDNKACVYSGRIFRQDVKSVFIDRELFAADNLIDLSSYGGKESTDNVIIGNDIYENEPGILRNYIVHNDINKPSVFNGLTETNDSLAPKDIASALSDTYSPEAEKFVPAILPVLEHLPIPSANLCKIYFNNWNYRMDTDSVAATIFNAFQIFLLDETIKDEMKDSSTLIMENYNYITDSYYELFSKGTSVLFDDINTKGSLENRDNIFDRAFIRTLRYLNKKRGPVMEKWKWGSVHRWYFGIPKGSDSFIDKRLNRMKSVEFPGGNSTMKSGTVNAVDLLKPDRVSMISGSFYLDLHMSFIAVPTGVSLDPQSEYFRNYSQSFDFISLEESEMQSRFILLPGGK